MIMPPPFTAIRRIVRSLGDCDSSDSESEAADKLLSDDEADRHVLSDIEGGSAWDTCVSTGECIREEKRARMNVFSRE